MHLLVRVGNLTWRRGIHTGGDGSPGVEELVASIGSLVVAWTSQHEGDLMELVGGCHWWRSNVYSY